jgi:hypothetical protein
MGKAMSLILGPALIGLAVAMIVLARSTDGEPVPFLKIWAVGQAYALAVLSSAVSGIIVTLSFWLA